MRLLIGALLLAAAAVASGQDLVVYDDAMQSGFVGNYSYGGGTNLLHNVTTHDGSAYAIAFTGNGSNAVAFPNETVDFDTAQYVGVRLFVHGGASGGQQLLINVYNNLGGMAEASGELDSFIDGGAIVAGEWRQVDVVFADAPLSFAGIFDRFDLQSDAGGAQPTLYIDDVTLIAEGQLEPLIFADNFEGFPGGVAGALRFTNVTYSIGESGGSATISVERVNGSSGAVSVSYATSDGTATQPSDYAQGSGMLSWLDGETGIRSFDVSVVDDASDEPDETIGLALSTATGGATLLAPASAVLTILDDDGPVVTPGQLRFSAASYSVGEGDASISITVRRVGGSDGIIGVHYASSNGSAVAPGDYTSSSGDLVWADGDAANKSFDVAIIDDATDEPDETIGLALSAATGGATLTAPTNAQLTILDDDPPPTPGQLRFSAASYEVGEDEASIGIIVQRVGGSDGMISVDYATSDGSAVAPDDYSSISGSLVWADGDAADQYFNVAIVDDGIPETNETVGLALSNPIGATLASPNMATLTIVEPELLYVPQYTANAIRIYRRELAGFVFLRSAPLAGVVPNALAFDFDGKLWVVDNGDTKRLLRYAQSALLDDVNPVAEVTISAVGGDSGEIFDMAFFAGYGYVSQSDFGGTNRVLKYSLAQLAASGSPAATLLTNADLSVPAGLEFDAQGRLWVSNYGNDKLVRMSASSGVADRVGLSAVIGARSSLSAPEGLGFDVDGSLWVGNNGKPTISAYAAWQLEDAGFGATVPIHQIDLAPGVQNPAGGHSGFVGGVAFDRDGDLWLNYENDYSVREFSLVPGPRGGGLPGVGSYASSAGQSIAAATTDPGFGGIAFWPRPASTHVSSTVFRGTNVVGMEMNYTSYSQATGPIGGTHYPVHDTQLIDYYAGKGMTGIRLLFSWEAMQSTLMGPIPAANSGNYKLYFDRYKAIVDYATNVKGMRVIVEPWQVDMGGGAGGPRWRGNLVGTVAVPTAAWSDFWSKFAGIYADNPRVSFGLINEPNNMSTMGWWAIAQAGVTAIRSAGATQRIMVPGNGYSAASTWVIGNAFYDTDATKRSNAYGWLNANGVGQPITDPLDNMVVEVHTYLDTDQGGSSTGITAITAARDHLAVVVNEARLRGYKVYLGEMGFLATVPNAAAAWADFIAYFEANLDVLVGFTWWAGGAPGWWDDVGASGGGHFSITPTNGGTFTGDTVNMDMIENDF